MQRFLSFDRSSSIYVNASTSNITRDLLGQVIARAGADNPNQRLQATLHVNRSLSSSTSHEQSENSFAKFLLVTHLRSRSTRILVFVLIASAYIWRSSRETWQGATVLFFSQLTVSASLGWLALEWLHPAAANVRRSHIETILSTASTISMLALPPLSYEGLIGSKNSIFTAVVRAFHPVEFDSCWM